MEEARSRAARVLVIEDDLTLRETVALALRERGYDVRAMPDGLELREALETFRPDLALLDVGLPVGPDGLSLARRIRDQADLGVLILTAADELQDRLAAFDAGADDYLGKPFSVAELLARVRALLRRVDQTRSESWQVGDLVVDEAAHTAVRANAVIELTSREFDLLVTLGAHTGRVLSKSQLLTAVWGFEHYDPNLVEVFISSLRRKLEAQGPRLIHTVRGVGYTLREQ